MVVLAVVLDPHDVGVVQQPGEACLVGEGGDQALILD